MPVASCVATGTACGRHPVASLLSMPVASCVATGTACGRHSVASLLPIREGFPQKLPLHQPAFPACVPKRGTGFFCCGHPRTEERSQRARPLRPCPDTAGCRALRHALRAWIRRLPVARPATAIASSTGPGYHALPTPGPPAATHDNSPAARRRDRHTQPDKRIGEGGADRMVAARPWPSGTEMLREKERNASKNSFSPLPPARKRHEFF